MADERRITGTEGKTFPNTMDDLLQAPEHQDDNVIRTNPADCMDCYRCVRACPVKAIRVTGGYAQVESELCIQCGNCVRECPQHAKRIAGSLSEVKNLVASGTRVAASVAPSFPAVFPDWQAERLPSALRQLGFSYVGETAEGAEAVSLESMKQLENGCVFTACPVVVRYVEQEHPELIEKLVRVGSPMIAHARILRKRLGDDIRVVFIGPCAAKKQEIKRPENKGCVDAALTFAELKTWLEESGIDLRRCPESAFDGEGGYDIARLFPLEGGMLQTCAIISEASTDDVVHPCGPHAVRELFDIPPSEWNFRAAEPLFCDGGCIGGPGFPENSNIYQRRRRVIDYVKTKKCGLPSSIPGDVDLSTRFSHRPRTLSIRDVSEADIERVLAATGKADKSQRLDCGACGYNSCREKAAAVVLGMAEGSICIPQMKRLAERKIDQIIELAPTGVVVLDEDLRITQMNRAFREMFICTDRVIGREISYLVNPVGFEKVAKGEENEVEAVRTKYGKRYQEIVLRSEDGKQYIGFYLNLSKIKLDSNQMNLIREETIDQAKNLLRHQIDFAQNMAQYLGESTAESEALLGRILTLYEEKE